MMVLPVTNVLMPVFALLIIHHSISSLKTMRSVLAALNLLCIVLVLFILFSSGFDVNLPNNRVEQRISQTPIPAAITFAGETVPLYDREVRERLDRELTNVTHQHSSTIRVMKLVQRYLPVIEDLLRRNGIPDDFKYLAIAESGLENVTSSKGAKGVWQFMDATATQYGLEISNEVDERLHLEKSTIAACSYLRSAYQRFGSWTMAAAAYNRGSAGMSEHTAEQQENSFYNLYLNSETSRYIFRILAFKQVLSNSQDYGYYFTSEDFYPATATKLVQVTNISDIATFARSYNTNYKTIKLLNPWLRSTALRGKNGKAYNVEVPL